MLDGGSRGGALEDAVLQGGNFLGVEKGGHNTKLRRGRKGGNVPRDEFDGVGVGVSGLCPRPC